MPINLNAFPLRIPDRRLETCRIPYDKESLESLRSQHRATHAFRRQGEDVLIFGRDGKFPVSGSPQALALQDNLGDFCFLVKDGLTRPLAGIGRRPIG